MTTRPRLSTTTASFLAVVAMACCMAVVPPLAQAAEEETHVFNAALSLTGGCGISSLDEVPDPGCPSGEHPPAGAFSNALAAATDSYGDIYIASYPAETSGSAARVDIFDAQGIFLSEISVPGARKLAVDSTGHLYVLSAWYPPEANGSEVGKLLRLDPTIYDPEKGKISYTAAPIEIPNPCTQTHAWSGNEGAIAVDAASQHLFADCTETVAEFGPAKPGEPNEVVTTAIGSGTLIGSRWLTVDSAHNKLYVTTEPQINTNRAVVHVYESSFPYTLLETIDGSTTPNKKFLAPESLVSVAVDEKDGHLFVNDGQIAHKVYEFEEDGAYVWTYRHGFEGQVKQINLDNGANSPNHGYLFVPSGEGTPSHVFAFEPLQEPEPPVVESVFVDGVGLKEAVLHARINPTGALTHYVFEYVTQQRYVEDGFSGATVAGEGEIPVGGEGVAVSAATTGLQPATQYRFRVVATNECEPGGCSSEDQGTFATFAQPIPSEGCSNETRRAGVSSALPDCRAFELVTPVDTNGRTPYAPLTEIAIAQPFSGPTVSAQGEDLLFTIDGGVIPETEGTGYAGDAYLASRTADGWQITSSSPKGDQIAAPPQGGVSPDQRYMVWSTGNKGGSLSRATGDNAIYLHYPDGSLRLVGQGSLGLDPQVRVFYVASGAAHVVFSTQGGTGVQLEPEAAPSGTAALYDRTADGVTHVVSLLPGDVPLGAGVTAVFQGVSDNGASIAFTVEEPGSPIYMRVRDTETLTASPPGATFEGLSSDGRYLFYLISGDLHRFDSQSGEAIQITASGDARPVVVSAHGTIYFLSRTALGVEAGPHGAEPQAAKENLYYWDGTTVHFVATVTERDAKGEPSGIGFNWNGLENWQETLRLQASALVAARASATGDVLLFQSRAALTSQSDGNVEVYRYDASEARLDCISCSPSGEAATGGATLESLTVPSLSTPIPTNIYSIVANLSPDGRRAFFESSQRLVSSDNDGVQDVYEWEADGTGSCRLPEGCVFLISSGRGSRATYLYGVSASGNDVFIETSDLLTPADTDETPSIYDARVEGGFAEPSPIAGECLGEACQPSASPPIDATPASASFQGNGDIAPQPKLNCPKAKRLVRSGGKQRCIAVRKKHSRHGKRTGGKHRHARKRSNTKGGAHR